MPNQRNNPRVLIVTSEVTYLPDRMGSHSNYLAAKAGGLADVSAALISALVNQGADVHVALPDYRSIFADHLPPFISKELGDIHKIMPDDRLHLAQDRAFYYINRVYSDYGGENTKRSLAFQREVINNIVPWVKPDLIHCNDWMTGLIPAMARKMGIPCLFTIHNVHTVKATLADIEDRGIDAACFWRNLYYDRMPVEYGKSRANNLVDFLISGVFAAHFVNTVSPRFLDEIVEGWHGFITPGMRKELTNKQHAGCAEGILNAPDPAFNPQHDPQLAECYGPEDHFIKKTASKIKLQRMLGLTVDESAPIFFWPSRLDPVQKGCQLLAEIFYQVISDYWEDNLQVIFVANGAYQPIFRRIVKMHGFQKRVAVCDFNQQLEHLAYGAADFVLMPSSFEPCGLPQMIGALYGALPVAHDTGGIHDTIRHLDVLNNVGNGFLFEIFDANGLFWAVTEAMKFFHLPQAVRSRQVNRIMKQSAETFNHSVTAGQYIDLYEKMLDRPLINDMSYNQPLVAM